MDILSNIAGWVSSLIDNVDSIAIEFLLLGFAFQWGQTLLNSVAWRSVLAAAYPDKKILQKEISAGYAGGVALNSVLPGQAGTITYLGLFRASIPDSSIATITAGAAVQAIFWSIVGGLVYLLLFISRPDAFESKLGGITDFITDHPLATIVIAAGTVALIVLALRVIRERLRRQWDQLGQGAAILHTPRRYLARVVSFQALSYACRIGVNITFMHAYGIPVTARNVFIIIAAASIAAVVSVAPGGIGATTTVLLIALQGEASQATITAYSVGQQAACMLANVVLGVILMAKVFGWDATRSLMHRQKKTKGESSAAGAEAIAARIEQERAQRESER
jgi:uncharacterized membrane protein YbhN (UPF0104 family)